MSAISGCDVSTLTLCIIGGYFTTLIIVSPRPLADVTVSNIGHISVAEQINLILRIFTAVVIFYILFITTRSSKAVVHGGGQDKRLFQLVKGGVIEGIVEPGANGAILVRGGIGIGGCTAHVGIPVAVRALVDLILIGLRIKDHIAKQGGYVAALVDDRPGDRLKLEPIHMLRVVTVCPLRAGGIGFISTLRAVIGHIHTTVSSAAGSNILIPHIRLFLTPIIIAVRCPGAAILGSRQSACLLVQMLFDRGRIAYKPGLRIPAEIDLVALSRVKLLRDAANAALAACILMRNDRLFYIGGMIATRAGHVGIPADVKAVLLAGGVRDLIVPEGGLLHAARIRAGRAGGIRIPADLSTGGLLCLIVYVGVRVPSDDDGGDDAV